MKRQVERLPYVVPGLANKFGPPQPVSDEDDTLANLLTIDGQPLITWWGKSDPKWYVSGDDNPFAPGQLPAWFEMANGFYLTGQSASAHAPGPNVLGHPSITLSAPTSGLRVTAAQAAQEGTNGFNPNKFTVLAVVQLTNKGSTSPIFGSENGTAIAQALAYVHSSGSLRCQSGQTAAPVTLTSPTEDYADGLPMYIGVSMSDIGRRLMRNGNVVAVDARPITPVGSTGPQFGKCGTDPSYSRGLLVWYMQLADDINRPEYAAFEKPTIDNWFKNNFPGLTP